MENRYKLSPDVQKAYLEHVESLSKLSRSELILLFGVVGRSYRDWKRGKFALPLRVVQIVEDTFHIPFPVNKQTALREWKIAKYRASYRGGIARLTKYGAPGTTEGRRKGGIRALEILRAKGIIPPAKPFFRPKSLSIELAEFVGILLGDGHISDRQWSVSLNSIDDKQYVQFIKRLVETLFHFSPSFFTRTSCKNTVIYGGGKNNILYLLELGLQKGNKVKQQVRVPQWVKDNVDYRKACLRGLVDTDGGIFLHKYVVNRKEYGYKKLSFSNRSLPLIDFAFETLKEIGLHPFKKTEFATKQVWLYNHKETKAYLEIIGTHNQRLLKN